MGTWAHSHHLKDKNTTTENKEQNQWIKQAKNVTEYANLRKVATSLPGPKDLKDY